MQACAAVTVSIIIMPGIFFLYTERQLNLHKKYINELKAKHAAILKIKNDVIQNVKNG